MAAQGDWEQVSEEPAADAEEGYEGEPVEAEAESTYEEPEGERGAREPMRGVTRPDKSVLAMLSGLGFFVVGLLLVLGVWTLASTVPVGAPAFLGVIVLGLILAFAIPYLWMLGDLRIRPRALRKSHARFIAGPMIGVLATARIRRHSARPSTCGMQRSVTTRCGPQLSNSASAAWPSDAVRMR